MITLELHEKFPITGARTRADGPHSGQEFFEDILLPQFQIVVDKKDKLKVVLDGTEGMASSFINEAFRRLAEKFGKSVVKNYIEIVSEEVPRYKIRALEAIESVDATI